MRVLAGRLHVKPSLFCCNLKYNFLLWGSNLSTINRYTNQKKLENIKERGSKKREGRTNLKTCTRTITFLRVRRGNFGIANNRSSPLEIRTTLRLVALFGERPPIFVRLSKYPHQTIARFQRGPALTPIDLLYDGTCNAYRI